MNDNGAPAPLDTVTLLRRCAHAKVVNAHQIHTLIVLHDNPDGVTPTQIAAIVGLTTGAVTGVLDVLEGLVNARRGLPALVKRQSNIHDRRFRPTILTDEGRAIFQEEAA